jgi:histidine triad (HIT) family protein
VAGAIPNYTVLETAHTLCFLDLFPASTGHALCVPKAHAAQLHDMDDDDDDAASLDLLRCVSKLGRAATQLPGVGGYNVVQNNGAIAGQVIHHVHFHVIPRRADDGLVSFKSGAKLQDAGAAKLLASFATALKKPKQAEEAKEEEEI